MSSDTDSSKQVFSFVSNSLSGRVAILGRPNVGKSTLFNILTDSRKALVKDEPGVTRDIQVGTSTWRTKTFDVIDTGGLTEAEDIFSKMIKESVLDLLLTVDLIVVVCDGRVGLVPEDKDVVRLAERSGKPFVVAVNKIDQHEKLDTEVIPFYELGAEHMVACSFENRVGTTEILEWLYDRLPEVEPPTKTDSIILTIVGKPNAGKSSLTNRLLGENRMLVTDIPGTTTDSIDSKIQWNDRQFTIIDTAGIRRKAQRSDGLEMLSAIQSEKTISRCDIALLVIDGTKGPTEQDARILEKILQVHKGVVLVVNKADLGRETIPAFRKTLREQINNKFHFFTDIEIAFISAKTGAGIDDLFRKIEELWEKLNFRVSTSELNDFFMKAIRKAPAPVAGAKPVKFYYATQTRQTPPSFITFANRPDGVSPSYRRFLINQIKDHWNLSGVPVRIFAMNNKGPKL